MKRLLSILSLLIIVVFCNACTSNDDAMTDTAGFSDMNHPLEPEDPDEPEEPLDPDEPALPVLE